MNDHDQVVALVIATPVVITIAYFIYWYFFKEEKDLDDYMVYTTYNQSAKRKLTTV